MHRRIGIGLLILLFLLSSRIVLCTFLFWTILLALLIQTKINKKVPYVLLLVFLCIWIPFLNVNAYALNADKMTVLSYIPPEFLPAQSRKITDSLKFPLILKPVRCTALGRGIHVVRTREELRKHEPLGEEYMVQEFVDFPLEGTLLYERGKLVAIVEKVSSGDIRAYCDPCKDITCLKTKVLEDIVVKISSMIPNFHVGRYDIRYETVEELQEGRFKILEANGTMGFDLRKDTFGFPNNIRINSRWFFLRWWTGVNNLFSRKGYSGPDMIRAMALTMRNAVECRDWEKLFAVYT